MKPNETQDQLRGRERDFAANLRELVSEKVGIGAVLVSCIAWLDFFRVFHNNSRSDRCTASRAKSFDDDLAILFELDWIKHAEIRLLACVAPGVLNEELLLRRIALRKVSWNSRHRVQPQ